MFGWDGGAGIDAYGGGCRRRIVASNILCTPAVSSAATRASPGGDMGAQRGTLRPRGRLVAAVFPTKQLPEPTPRASARSARPLPETMFLDTRLPRGRQGGPGSRWTPGSNTILRAVG